MACYHPLSGYRTPGGSVTFDRSSGFVDVRVTVSCGQCWGCRLERSRQWAVRCIHEAQLYEANSFITLTYSDDQLPEHGSLYLPHWQKFAKRFRKKLGAFRFFHCGEYGETTGRPHLHSAIFGHDFAADRRPFSKKGGYQTYTSDLLDELWSHGNCLIGSLTFESAAYVARYIMKKVNGDQALTHYETDQVDTHTGEVFRLKPEYITMSRRPGIGKPWLEKFEKDVYPSDQVIINGKPSRPPSFYDYCLEQRDPSALAALKRKRVAQGRKHRKNNTPERLAIRERCARSKTQSLKRTL